jgi:hypothetical protein
MTFKQASKISKGDVVKSKDRYSFAVNEIELRTNSANTQQYLFFKGTTKNGLEIGYDHKQLNK